MVYMTKERLEKLRISLRELAGEMQRAREQIRTLKPALKKARKEE